MDFQELADRFQAPTCIISVEEKEGDEYGAIRIVAGNKQYIEPIEQTAAMMTGGKPGGPVKFIPNSRYETYLPKDLGFEEICCRCALLKKPVHTYVNMNFMNVWFDIFIMPLDCDDGDLRYCTYTAQPCSASELGLSSSVAGRTAEDVLKTCIKLHGTDDLKETMQEVIQDIRLICRAEVCTIMLIEPAERTCSVLATSIAENSGLKRVTEFPDFFRIASSWEEMLGARDCFIVKSDQDMEYVRMVNEPWYDTLVEAGVNSAVLFPLRNNGELLGFIWAINFDTGNTMRIKETLELTTFFISSEIASFKMMEKLRHISYTDLLTGLPNRFFFSDQVSELIKKNIGFTVVSIDINGFKSINSTIGFDAGNKVLIAIASLWKEIADSSPSQIPDLLARLGGDEFALLLRGYDSEEAVSEEIRKYEAALGSRLTIDDYDLYITASFGYASCPGDADNLDSLLSYADSAMQEVKRANSSNHIMRFAPGLLRIERTLELERKIREALDNDSVYFHLQPQYDMSHKLRGFEALARMKDEDGTVISPAEFIPVAEEVGLIDKVDAAVFRKSAVFLGGLIEKCGADITLSVNVSVRHLMKHDFLDEVRGILKSSGISPDHLEIEITESIMIDSDDKALERINEIKALGIKLAIDDFGTGYSSLSYLNRFPADLLKIDKSFIDKMNTGESPEQYVAAIISIGHIMDFDVIAEGVEEQWQLDTLKKIGCDFIQGYIWGRPLPPEEAGKLLALR